MSYTVIVGVENARPVKFVEGLESLDAAQSHAAAHGGEVVDAAVLGGRIEDWRRADDGTWSVSPAVPSDAERAAPIALSRAKFFLALDQTMGLTEADPPADTWLEQQIAATDALDAATKRMAATLVRNAGSFLRVDPDAPGLMDAIGATVLGLSSPQIDAMFLAAAGLVAAGEG